MTLVIVGGIVDAFALVLAVALWCLVRSVERVNRETTKQGEALDRISKEAGEAYNRLVEVLDRAEGRSVGGGATAGEAKPTCVCTLPRLYCPMACDNPGCPACEGEKRKAAIAELKARP